LFKALPIRVIPHGLDLKHYKPISPAIARDLLGLPHHQKLVLFGASPGTTSHERKGFHLLRSALQLLSKTEWGETIELVIFGASQPNPPFDVGMKTHYVGSLRDDISLALVYSAADVIVVPSLQEAFGLTAAESLACGTPVVAFAATGLRDIVNHQQNGYLAQPFEVQDLATGLIWVLEDADRHDKLCTNARSKAEQEYSSALQVQRHLDLYDRILHLAKCA
jgi:glycosyltransferase involved in cell wall biosynthesis